MVDAVIEALWHARFSLHRQGALEEGDELTIERDELGFDAPAPLGHPGRLGLLAGRSTGPEVGERLPDFELPDAYGNRVAFHTDRGDNKAVLVFFRSAVW